MRVLTESELWRTSSDPVHVARMESGAGLDGDAVATRTQVTYTRPNGHEVCVPLLEADAGDIDGARMARPIPKYRGRRNYSGFDVVMTGGRTIEFESRLEHARIMIADFDPAVTAITSQPMRLTYTPRGGKAVNHYPDLLLLTTSGPLLVDVTSENALHKAKRVAIFTWTAAAVRAVGWRYEVWSGADPIAMANLTLLSACRRPMVVDSEIVTQACAFARSTQMNDLVDQLSTRFPPMLVKPAVRHALWRGMYRSDMSESLQGDSWLTYVPGMVVQ